MVIKTDGKHFLFSGVLPELTIESKPYGDYLVAGGWSWATDEESADGALEAALAWLALYKHLANAHES